MLNETSVPTPTPAVAPSDSRSASRPLCAAAPCDRLPDGQSLASSNSLLPEGIHFGLPEALHHADPAIGGTLLKCAVQSPSDFWERSHLNPDRAADPDKPHQVWGRAFHKLLLEGRAAFDAAFATPPDPASDTRRVLVTLDHMKSFAREKGEPVSGTKAELAQRLDKHLGAGTVIWDEVMKAFEAEVEAKGQTIIPAEQRREVERAAEFAGANPHLRQAFRDGAPEVTVIWTEDGQRYKARIDYLKPRAVVELKHFSNPLGKPLDVAMRMAIATYRYDLAAAHYLDGYAHLLEHARAGRVFGKNPLPRGWWKRLASADEVRLIWVFLQRGGAPVARAIEVSPQSPAFSRARADIITAKRAIHHCLQRFGTKPWIDDTPIQTLSEADLPFWLRGSMTDDASLGAAA